jgi:hypothetical protein
VKVTLLIFTHAYSHVVCDMSHTSENKANSTQVCNTAPHAHASRMYTYMKASDCIMSVAPFGAAHHNTISRVCVSIYRHALTRVPMESCHLYLHIDKVVCLLNGFSKAGSLIFNVLL